MLFFVTGLFFVLSFKAAPFFMVMVPAIFFGASLPTVLSFSKRLKTSRALVLGLVSLGTLFFYGDLSKVWEQLFWQLFVISYYFAFVSIYLAERKARVATEALARLARFALRDELDKIFSQVRNLQPSTVMSIPIEGTRLPEHAQIASVFSRNGWEVEMRFAQREGVVLVLRAPSSLKQMDKSLSNISCEIC
jgi:hypothetical protein